MKSEFVSFTPLLVIVNWNLVLFGLWYVFLFFNSQGFDVGSSRGLRIPGGITPVNLDRLGDYIEKLNDLCKLTMQDYNEKEVAASCYFVMV